MSHLSLVSFVLLLLAGSTALAEARLGETLEQCTARYGRATPARYNSDSRNSAPLPISPQDLAALSLTSNDLAIYSFERGEISITIRFVKDKAVFVTFRIISGNMPTPFSQVQVDTLLEANAGGMHWKKTSSTTTDPSPNSDDNPGAENATYLRDDGSRAFQQGIELILVSPDWPVFVAALIEAEKQRVADKQRKALEGF